MEPQDHKAVLLDTSRELVFGFLLFEGFEVLDLYGPVELFDSLRRAGKVLVSNPGSKLDCEQIWKPCHLQAKFVTVAATRGPGVSAQGPATTAQHTLEDCPRLDVLLVPGGPGTRREVKDRPLLPWLRKTYPQLQLLLSVCTGEPLEPRMCCSPCTHFTILCCRRRTAGRGRPAGRQEGHDQQALLQVGFQHRSTRTLGACGALRTGQEHHHSRRRVCRCGAVARLLTSLCGSAD